MSMDWKGCVIKESLADSSILNNLKTLQVRTANEDEPSERWHIHDVVVSEKDIKNLHERLREGWYMHFWFESKMIVLFKDRKFILDINDRESWKAAIAYGVSIGIPEEQLEFKIEF